MNGISATQHVSELSNSVGLKNLESGDVPDGPNGFGHQSPSVLSKMQQVGEGIRRVSPCDVDTLQTHACPSKPKSLQTTHSDGETSETIRCDSHPSQPTPCDAPSSHASLCGRNHSQALPCDLEVIQKTTSCFQETPQAPDYDSDSETLQTRPCCESEVLKAASKVPKILQASCEAENLKTTLCESKILDTPVTHLKASENSPVYPCRSETLKTSPHESEHVIERPPHDSDTLQTSVCDAESSVSPTFYDSEKTHTLSCESEILDSETSQTSPSDSDSSHCDSETSERSPCDLETVETMPCNAMTSPAPCCDMTHDGSFEPQLQGDCAELEDTRPVDKEPRGVEEGQPGPEVTNPSNPDPTGVDCYDKAGNDQLPSLPAPPTFSVEVYHENQVSDGQENEKDRSSPVVVEMKIVQKEDANQNQAPPAAERCDSTLSSISDRFDICRICHCEGEENNKLISPCLCAGSLKYVHLGCLQKWIKSSDKKACELCNYDYSMSTKTRPFKQWEKLELTSNERRKIICSVTFHIIAITCVIWSLYVLIDRTTDEVHSGSLDWPFWTKLIVVAIGFTGGLIFMYVQCKMYVRLFVRWRTFNKLITVENAPEDPHLRAEAAAKIKAKSEEQGGEVNPVALQEVDSV